MAGLALAYVVVTIFLKPSPEKEFENYVRVFQETYGITFSVDYCPEGANKANGCKKSFTNRVKWSIVVT